MNDSSLTFLPGRAKQGLAYQKDPLCAVGLNRRQLHGRADNRLSARDPRHGRKNRRKARS